MLMADLCHLDRAPAGAVPPSCSSSSTWPTRRSKPVAAYSGGMRRRLDLAMTLVGDPRDHLPRRADHRPRPAQPPGHVARSSAQLVAERRHDPAHHAVPGRGRPARRPGRAARPRPAVAEGTPASSSGSSRAGTCVAVRRRRRSSTRRRGRARPHPRRRRRSPSRCRATAASSRCAPCSAISTTPPSRSPTCPCTPPTSTTSSSPSPSARHPPTDRHERVTQP